MHFVAIRTNINELMTLVSESRIRPDQIVLEITERQEIEDSSRAVDVIASLKSIG